MEIYTVKQLVDTIPALTEGGVRWQIFNKNSNGLSESGAIIKNGRRVLIEFPAYLKWLRNGKEGSQ